MAKPTHMPALYELHIDLRMCYCPPMDDRGQGITLRRKVELPFPPFNGLAIAGSALDVCPMPEGFVLKSVVWDCDRSRFTASTQMAHHDLPIAFILDDLSLWCERGWRLGSSADDFPDEYEVGGGQAVPDVDEATPSDEWIEDDENALAKLSPRKRPKEFNKMFRALIRMMCETRNATGRAYAMWKTQRFYSEDDLKTDESPSAVKFKDAEFEFSQMAFEEQYEWREQICKNYPRLDRMLRDA